MANDFEIIPFLTKQIIFWTWKFKFYNSQHSLLGHGHISAGNKMNLRELLLLMMAGQAIRPTDMLRIIRQDRIIIWDRTETQRGLGNFPSEHLWVQKRCRSSTVASLGKRNKKQGTGLSKQQGWRGRWCWKNLQAGFRAQSAFITQSIIGSAHSFMPKVGINPSGINNTHSS